MIFFMQGFHTSLLVGKQEARRDSQRPRTSWVVHRKASVKACKPLAPCYHERTCPLKQFPQFTAVPCRYRWPFWAIPTGLLQQAWQLWGLMDQQEAACRAAATLAPAARRSPEAPLQAAIMVCRSDTPLLLIYSCSCHHVQQDPWWHLLPAQVSKEHMASLWKALDLRTLHRPPHLPRPSAPP